MLKWAISLRWRSVQPFVKYATKIMFSDPPNKIFWICKFINQWHQEEETRTKAVLDPGGGGEGGLGVTCPPEEAVSALRKQLFFAHYMIL